MNARRAGGRPGRYGEGPGKPTSRGEREMSVHLTPDEIADLLEVEPHVIEHAAGETSVPVYQGRIDRVLFAEALIAAGHHLAPLARERLVREGDLSG